MQPFENKKKKKTIGKALKLKTKRCCQGYRTAFRFNNDKTDNSAIFLPRESQLIMCMLTNQLFSSSSLFFIVVLINSQYWHYN